jgi:hypothetical protein
MQSKRIRLAMPAVAKGHVGTEYEIWAKTIKQFGKSNNRLFL